MAIVCDVSLYCNFSPRRLSDRQAGSRFGVPAERARWWFDSAAMCFGTPAERARGCFVALAIAPRCVLERWPSTHDGFSIAPGSIWGGFGALFGPLAVVHNTRRAWLLRSFGGFFAWFRSGLGGGFGGGSEWFRVFSQWFGVLRGVFWSVRRGVLR